MTSLAISALTGSPCLAQAKSKPGFSDEVSYTNDIAPVVKNFCTTCHAGNDPEGDFVLTSYADVRKHTEQGELLKRINDAQDPMPQKGLMPPHLRRLFQAWAEAGYLCEESDKSLIELAKLSRDPRTIEQIMHLSKLSLSIKRNAKTRGKRLLIYLSQKPFTDERGKFMTQGGYLRSDLLDTILLFPELSESSSEFTITYLHPGDYFLTVVADMNNDGFPAIGDIATPTTKVHVEPEIHLRLTVDRLTTQN